MSALSWHWHVEGAYNPSDRGSSAGGNHLVLEEPLRYGRLVRQEGDALCKPAKKFWGLTGRGEDRVLDCHHCIRQAFRLGWDFDALPVLDLGRSWSAILVIEGGNAKRVEFRNRWFGHPPAVPPTAPSVEWLLRAVRALVPQAKGLALQGWATGEHVGGTAVVVE